MSSLALTPDEKIIPFHRLHPILSKETDFDALYFRKRTYKIWCKSSFWYTKRGVSR